MPCGERYGMDGGYWGLSSRMGSWMVRMRERATRALWVGWREGARGEGGVGDVVWVVGVGVVLLVAVAVAAAVAVAVVALAVA